MGLHIQVIHEFDCDYCQGRTHKRSIHVVRGSAYPNAVVPEGWEVEDGRGEITACCPDCLAARRKKTGVIDCQPRTIAVPDGSMRTVQFV